MIKTIRVIASLFIVLASLSAHANKFSDNTFLIAHINSADFNNAKLWKFIEGNNWTALEFDIDSLNGEASLKNSTISLNEILERIAQTADNNESKIIPVFIHFKGNIHLLDSIIGASPVSRRIFFLPQGETWPSTEYLVQADRRIIFFIDGDIENESSIFHPVDDYALQISANQITPNSVILSSESNINRELFKINNFHRLPTGRVSSRLGKNMIPDYVNFLLESWTKYGKKPNFIDVGRTIMSFYFVVDQLNSFNAVSGIVKTTGKNMERVYWKNSDILVSGGRFSFPIRGGEEVILSPFAPGYAMTPAQMTITGEMDLRDEYSIMANPLNLSAGLTASFRFNGTLQNEVHPDQNYTGINYSFTEDIERGSVLKLPEDAKITLGDPNQYGFPNSSFTVSCFVKFTDIPQYGDNAILGNDEIGYRRGMHLILRSGHPYFGLWSNDYMSDEILKTNTWYHLAWRYIIETGQQAIFLNGKYVGGSDGHPPYSGTSDLHIGSALSRGASLRYIWNRPLGIEEINRLSLDEEVKIVSEKAGSVALSRPWLVAISGAILVLFLLAIMWVILLRKREKPASLLKEPDIVPTKNRMQLFGEFKAVNTDEEDITSLFTPKVKELLVFTIVHNLLNKSHGASIAEIDATLWEGIPPKKVANNRAVTLNKLRKILVQFDKLEIVSGNGYLLLKTDGSFFCDFQQAFNLCQIPKGMSREQLEIFFHLVKEGSLLKGIDWPWLDEIRGYIGNQVIDNLLKLASFYKKEHKLKDVDNVAKRILDYDNLSEEAVHLQVWSQQMAKNTHLAKFHFDSFCTRYEKSMGQKYGMSFKQFIENYDN